MNVTEKTDVPRLGVNMKGQHRQYSRSENSTRLPLQIFRSYLKTS
jgi:hypothetical protein